MTGSCFDDDDDDDVLVVAVVVVVSLEFGEEGFEMTNDLFGEEGVVVAVNEDERDGDDAECEMS